MAEGTENTDSGSGLSALDLFSQETVEEEENTLAKSLPEVDIYELLEDCKRMLSELDEALAKAS